MTAQRPSPRGQHWLATLAAALLLTGCGAKPPIETVDQVDLQRFMGDWYVIAHIPAPLEDNAYNAVESYRLEADGRVATTFRFREGGYRGETYTYRPTGFVREDTGNAVWDMQFWWPIRFEYRIVYLDDTYRHTIIGRRARDYAWIMARSPDIPEQDLRHLVDILERRGYDVGQLRMVPQRWPEHPAATRPGPG